MYKTLKELNVQVGDVVKSKYVIRANYEVEGVGSLRNIKDDFTFDYSNSWDNKPQWTIVSRATVPVNQLVVGETYTSRNGSEWEAFYGEGDLMYMKIGIGHNAYVFKTDGTPVSFAHDSDYTIDLGGPIVVEGVHCITGLVSVDDTAYSTKMTVTTIDGKPDWTTLKVVECTR